MPSSQNASSQPIVSVSVKNDVSPPLRNLTPVAMRAEEMPPLPVRPLPHTVGRAESAQLQGASRDPVWQASIGSTRVPDGYYSLFAPAGSRDITASFGSVSVTQTVLVPSESSVVQDSYLPLYVIILILMMK